MDNSEYIYCYTNKNIPDKIFIADSLYNPFLSVKLPEEVIIAKKVVNSNEKIQIIHTLIKLFLKEDMNNNSGYIINIDIIKHLFSLCDGINMYKSVEPHYQKSNLLKYCKYCDNHVSELYEHIKIKHHNVNVSKKYIGTSIEGNTLGGLR
jgi:hypothetical protein